MRFIKRLALLAALFVAVVIVAGMIFGFEKPQQTKAPTYSQEQMTLDAGLAAEAQWEKAKAGAAGAEPPDPGAVDRITDAIGKIPSEWPRAAEARALADRLRAARPSIAKAHDAMMDAYAKKVRAQTEAENLAARKAYPKKAEKVFLDAGQDFYLTVEGKDLRTLRIRYVLMSRPLVHQLTNSAKVVDTWRDIGFRKVIFTDGYNSTWTWSLE